MTMAYFVYVYSHCPWSTALTPWKASLIRTTFVLPQSIEFVLPAHVSEVTSGKFAFFREDREKSSFYRLEYIYFKVHSITLG